MEASVCGSAFAPAIATAGSPGTTNASMNVMIEVPSRTAAPNTMRRGGGARPTTHRPASRGGGPPPAGRARGRGRWWRAADGGARETRKWRNTREASRCGNCANRRNHEANEVADCRRSHRDRKKTKPGDRRMGRIREAAFHEIANGEQDQCRRRHSSDKARVNRGYQDEPH